MWQSHSGSRGEAAQGLTAVGMITDFKTRVLVSDYLDGGLSCKSPFESRMEVKVSSMRLTTFCPWPKVCASPTAVQPKYWLALCLSSL